MYKQKGITVHFYEASTFEMKRDQFPDREDPKKSS
jgi:hypothetical protein